MGSMTCHRDQFMYHAHVVVDYTRAGLQRLLAHRDTVCFLVTASAIVVLPPPLINDAQRALERNPSQTSSSIKASTTRTQTPPPWLHVWCSGVTCGPQISLAEAEKPHRRPRHRPRLRPRHRQPPRRAYLPAAPTPQSCSRRTRGGPRSRPPAVQMTPARGPHSAASVRSLHVALALAPRPPPQPPPRPVHRMVRIGMDGVGVKAGGRRAWGPVSGGC